MKSRIPSIACVLVGVVFLFVSVRSLLHHQYDYYNSVKQIWISYFAMLALGVWFVVYGLIGLVRRKLENTE
jgi:hypothetical protein